MEDFILQLLKMSITASVCAAAVMLCRLVFKKLPGKFMGILWLAVLFRLLCPVSFELPVKGADSFSEMVFARLEVPVTEGVLTVLPEGTPELLPRPTSVASAPPAPTFDHAPETAPDFLSLWEWAFIIWCAGAAAAAFTGLRSTLKLRKKLDLSVRSDDAWELPGLPGPMVFGIFRPRIYLPAGLEGQARELVICHERAHIKRLDHIVKPLYFAAVCLHWFNPVIWASFFMMSRDAERACDEKVLSTFGADIKKSYSGSLLSFACGHKYMSPVAFGEENVKGRIKNVLKWKRPGMLLTVFALLLAAVLAVFLLSDSRENEGEDPPVSTSSSVPSLTTPSRGELTASSASAGSTTTLPRASTSPTRPISTTTTVTPAVTPDVQGVSPIGNVLLDGKSLGGAEDFFTVYNGLTLINAGVIGEMLGFEVVTSSAAPVKHGGASIPAHTLAVFYEGYVTTMAVGDPYAVTYRIGESEPLYFPQTAMSPVEIGGEMFIDPCLLPYLFFVKEDIYSINFPEEMRLISLDAYAEKAKSYAESKGYRYEPTGDPFYDRHIFRESFIGTKKGSAAVFNMNVGRMLMGPVLGELIYSDFGWLWKVDGKYGLFVHSFGYESIKPRYDSISCIDFRARVLILEKNGRYSAAHCPTGMDQVTVVMEGSPTVPTAEEVMERLHRMGLTGGGEWRSVFYVPEYTLTESGIMTTGSGVEVILDHPFEWTPMGGNMLGELVPEEGSAAARAEIGYAVKLAAEEYHAKAQKIFHLLFPGEKPLTEEHIDAVITDDNGSLLRRGGDIWKYTLLSPGGPLKTRWLVYTDGYLITVTTYGLYDEDHWENAVFQRMITSLSAPQ